MDWFVAVSNTNCERRAQKGLEERGFEVWYPKRVVEFRVGPKRREACRLVPAYGNYLFVRGSEWQRMYGVDGLKAILKWRSDDEWFPVRVPETARTDREIGLADVRRAFSLTPVPIVEDIYRIGSKVFVVDGPFVTFEAVIQKLVGKDRLIVEADILGKRTPIRLSRAQCDVVAA